MAEKKDIDEFTGIETTGHDWDGIKELNNPLPRWWIWTFYVTVAWGLAYTVVYPAWPLLSSSTQGIFGWSSRASLAESVSAADAARADLVSAVAEKDVAAIVADDNLRQFAINGGKAAYKVNCVQCHGSGATGSPGYPNLNDDDWIWGGTIEEIHTTLMHGVRSEADDDTRLSDMPAFGADDLLDDDQISDVAWYVRKISGQEADEAAAGRGASVYADECASCHGDNGEGVRDVGGPRLSDAIWLYGGSHDEIVVQIAKPRQGVMPGWQARLGDVTVKQMAVYVHSLGGGE